MNQRHVTFVLVPWLIALIGMILACGGTGNNKGGVLNVEPPQEAKHNGLPVEPPLPAKSIKKLNFKEMKLGVIAYDNFPEPYRTQLIKDWQNQVAAVEKGHLNNLELLQRTATKADQAQALRWIDLDKLRFDRLKRNNPPYVTKEAVNRITREREKDERMVEVRSKWKAQAEAEAKIKNEVNRKAYDAEVEKLKAQHTENLEKYKEDKNAYEMAYQNYLNDKAEFEATRKLALVRDVFRESREKAAEKKEAEAKYLRKFAEKGFREIINMYPGTQSAKDAESFLSNGYAKPRQLPPEPVGLNSPIAPRLVLPPLPDPVPLIYPPDPLVLALEDAAQKTEIAIEGEMRSFRAAEAEAAQAEADAARRAKEAAQKIEEEAARRTKEAAVKEARTNPCTAEKYNRIQTGMSYQEVFEIMGVHGQELSRVEIGDISTVLVLWENRGLLDLGNMNVTFQNGRVVAKAQFGLR